MAHRRYIYKDLLSAYATQMHGVRNYNERPTRAWLGLKVTYTGERWNHTWEHEHALDTRLNLMVIELGVDKDAHRKVIDLLWRKRR